MAQFVLDRVSSRFAAESFRGFLKELDGVVNHDIGLSQGVRLTLLSPVQVGRTAGILDGVFAG